jgi:hypothetical protein
VYRSTEVAYAQARTILWISKSKIKQSPVFDGCNKSEFNKLFETFRLRPGMKWQDVECEIFHGIDEVPVTILAYSIHWSYSWY